MVGAIDPNRPRAVEGNGPTSSHWDNAIHQLQPKPRIEVAAVVFSAAGETCDRAANATHARKIFSATRTSVNKTRSIGFRWEGEIVTTDFVADSEVPASIAPFRAVRQDSASTFYSKLREQMSQFVTQRSIDLLGAVIAKSRI